jgi:CxxC motif-containing protein
MEQRRLICIECPKGCDLTVDLVNFTVAEVRGHTCPKGEVYARAEIEHPMRQLATIVLAEGLEVRMVPVKTSDAIPRDRLLDAMNEVRALRLTHPVKTGDVIVENFLGLGVDLIATRAVRAV